jgi:hypothetical protein
MLHCVLYMQYHPFILYNKYRAFCKVDRSGHANITLTVCCCDYMRLDDDTILIGFRIERNCGIRYESRSYTILNVKLP